MNVADKTLVGRTRASLGVGFDWLRRAALGVWRRKTTVITALAISGIVLYRVMRYGLCCELRSSRIPLLVTLAAGGLPLLLGLLRRLLRREFGSDLLGGISIVTSVILGQYLAGAIIVLMLAGGEALEGFALRRASVLAALASSVAG